MNTTEKLAEALREIAGAHIPDMPCAVNDPEGWRERHFNRLRHIARAALAAHDAEQVSQAKPAPAQAVPAGFKLVPVEPTPEMVKAGASEAPLAIDAAHVYRTMLAAAPAAPAPEAQAAGQDERAAFGAWFQGYRHGWKSEKDVTFDAWQARAALAQRQPLTDEQIAEGRYRMWADELEDAPEPWSFLKGARWAERYYGIGGTTTGEQR